MFRGSDKEFAMQEFVVVLRNGLRFTVKAHRVIATEGTYIALVDDSAIAAGSADPLAGAVGLFTRDEVALVFSKGHLLGEEKGEPINPQYVVGGQDIPF
jgi:hypothetical protein